MVVYDVLCNINHFFTTFTIGTQPTAGQFQPHFLYYLSFEVTGFSYILSKKKRYFVIISIYFCKRNLKYFIGFERFPVWFQWSPVIIECMEAKIFIGVRNHVRYRQV